MHAFRNEVRISAITLFLFVVASASAQTQAPIASSAPGVDVPVIHTGTSLTLVDVIAEQTDGKLHTRQLLTEIKQADFRLFDNDREVEIRGFDVGTQHTVRAVALWLIVQCNQDSPIGWGSGFIRDTTHWLAPALAALQPNDVIGVAHWCDDGTVKLDLPPSIDGTKALTTVEAILHAKASGGENRRGELALQKLFIDVINATEDMSLARLPVLLFLYGDHSATYVNEARDIIKSLLESSGIVFGLNDPGSEAKLSETSVPLVRSRTSSITTLSRQADNISPPLILLCSPRLLRTCSQRSICGTSSASARQLSMVSVTAFGSSLQKQPARHMAVRNFDFARNTSPFPGELHHPEPIACEPPD